MAKPEIIQDIINIETGATSLSNIELTGTTTLPSTTNIGTVTGTEIAYLSGVTSAIQTQINTKSPLASPTFTGTPAAPTPSVGTNTTQIATTEFVKTAVDAAGAAGEVAFFARDTAPTGWLKANGSAISRTTYASLFSAIGTTFGVGDGSTTFNLPDMRGYFPRGWDDGRGIDSGRAFGSTQTDDNKSHDHQYGLGYTNSSSMWHTTYSAALAAGDSNVFTTSGYTGIKPSGGTEARPKNISLLACIKY